MDSPDAVVYAIVSLSWFVGSDEFTFTGFLDLEAKLENDSHIIALTISILYQTHTHWIFLMFSVATQTK